MVVHCTLHGASTRVDTHVRRGDICGLGKDGLEDRIVVNHHRTVQHGPEMEQWWDDVQEGDRLSALAGEGVVVALGTPPNLNAMLSCLSDG